MIIKPGKAALVDEFDVDDTDGIEIFEFIAMIKVSFFLTETNSARGLEELGPDIDKRTFASCSWLFLVCGKNIDFFRK